MTCWTHFIHSRPGGAGSSKLKYRYGPAFVFLIYTGLRIGELCALQGKDFDLEKRTVSITKNLMEIYNRDYGVGHEKVAQYTTKTRSTRIVPLNQKALMVYELMRQAALYTDPGDYVLCTARRKPATPRQMERRLALSTAINWAWFAALWLSYAAPHLCKLAVLKKAASRDYRQHIRP